jgi:hypothetical protein
VKNPTSFEEFWPIYLRAHSEPATRALHVGGAVVGLGCGAVFLATGHPSWAVIGLVAAYGLAWIGHALIERNVPATFSHPLWSIRGDLRMVRLAFMGRLSEEVAKRSHENETSAGDR